MKNFKFTGMIPLLQLRGAPATIAMLVTTLLAAASLYSVIAKHGSGIQHERLMAVNSLGIIRSELEGSLNSRLLLGQGLVSYISIKPGLTAVEFRDYCRILLSSDPMIRNITVLKNTTIAYAYPLESNRKAIGVDIAKIPAQRDAVMKLINTGKATVSANVKLVQGGVATICRLPVHTSGTQKYWGQVSIVLMQDVLFRESGIYGERGGLRILLTSIDDEGLPGKVLYGEQAINDMDPVRLDVIFPHGAWRLSAVPEKGWGHSESNYILYAAAGCLVSVMIGLLIFTVLKQGQRVEQLERILPICSNCKKIRNDKGYWDSVEAFFSRNPGVKFSHSLCPECADKLYGSQSWYNRKKAPDDKSSN